MTKRVDCWEVDGHRDCSGYNCKACKKCNYNNICRQALLDVKEARQRYLETNHDPNDWGAKVSSVQGRGRF